MIERAAHTDNWIWRVNQNQDLFLFLLSISFANIAKRIKVPFTESRGFLFIYLFNVQYIWKAPQVGSTVGFK